YATLPRALNTDGSSLYVMLRNISGSVGISLATAMIRQRSQVHQAYLVNHLTPYDQGYNDYVAQLEATMRAHDWAGDVHATAMGMVYQQLASQAAILSYIDVFSMAAVVAFVMVPLVFLFKGTKPQGGAAAPAH
ncbi:MAG: EmrB/QacA family drug resistance transporter, partial [Acidisphaera sp.]|nr:EmrB/QacA family drug resistance transporter [Acidisphaera sp.]